MLHTHKSISYTLLPHFFQLQHRRLREKYGIERVCRHERRVMLALENRRYMLDHVRVELCGGLWAVIVPSCAERGRWVIQGEHKTLADAKIDARNWWPHENAA